MTSFEPQQNRETIRVAIWPSNEGIRSAKYASLYGTSNTSGAGDSRRIARRDRDKLLYTYAWRRLAGVTQVVSPDGEDALLHTRLTHSEKVAQVAWSIGSDLINGTEEQCSKIAANGGLDLDIIETAALAHDLGHPPFGHIGEKALDEWGLSHGLNDGFEGNAQTFRILTRLARWSPDHSGLSLTAGTFAAVLKYPWLRGADKLQPLPDDEQQRRQEIAKREHLAKTDPGTYRYWSKFGAYSTEEQLLAKARAWLPSAFFDTEGGRSVRQGDDRYCQTYEASVMDLADDIAYAVHDFEDFATSGTMDLPAAIAQYQLWDDGKKDGWYGQTQQDLEKKYPEYFKSDEYHQAARWLNARLQEAHREAVTTKYATREYLSAPRTSEFLSKFLRDIEVLGTPAWAGGPMVILRSEAWHRVNLLKSATMRFVVASPAVAAHQRSATRIVRRLANELFAWIEDDFDRLPPELGEHIKALMEDGATTTEAERARCVIDYITSLNDHATRSLLQMLRGRTGHSLVRALL